MILALVVGPRTQASANELITRTASVLVGSLPLFSSDGLTQYETALFDRWHVEVPYPPTGRRGRPRNPARVPLPGLRYGQVVKQREGRRLVSVTRRVVFGPGVRARSHASPVGATDARDGRGADGTRVVAA